MSTAAVRRYWTRVVELGCVVCESAAEIAHAHGGSIVERMQEPKAKGVKLPRYDWLVLPLCPWHHRLGGPGDALDAGVVAWELVHGTQASHIDRIAVTLQVAVWAAAREGRK